jgi:hypothetical protein
MKRVRLFVTGKAEEALPAALKRLFPAASFTAGRWCNARGNQEGGFTSTRLVPSARTQRAERLLGEMVGSVMRGGDADYAIFLDDLELANHGCESDVCAYFRQAATVLARTKSKPTVRALRERISVHLLAPMLEAYLLADPGCWSAAGLVSSVVPKLRPGAPEKFATDDPNYLAAPAGTDYRCIHPKEYMQHLVQRGGGTYSEATQGMRALEAVDLRRAWGSPHARWHLIGALIDDVADMLGVPALTPARFLAPTSHSQGTVLRNL